MYRSLWTGSSNLICPTAAVAIACCSPTFGNGMFHVSSLRFGPKMLSRVTQIPLFPGTSVRVRAFDGDYKFDYSAHTKHLALDSKPVIFLGVFGAVIPAFYITGALVVIPGVSAVLGVGAASSGGIWACIPSWKVLSLYYCAFIPIGCKLLSRGVTNSVVKDLTGQVAVVTGGTSGMGREVAMQLSKMGATVVIVSRNNSDKQKETEDYIRQYNPNADVHFRPLDLGYFSMVRTWLQIFSEEFGQVNILVNCASQMHEKPTLNFYGDEEQVSSNLLGPYLFTESLLPFVEASNGRIVYVSSSAHLCVNEEKLVKSYLHKNGKEWNPNFLKDKSFDAIEHYGFTKLGNIFHAQDLAYRSYPKVGAQKSGLTPFSRKQSEIKLLGSKHACQAHSSREDGGGPDVEEAGPIVQPKFTSCAVNPGSVLTPLYRHIRCNAILSRFYYILAIIMKTPYEGSQSIVNCCLRDDIVNGGYYQDCAYTPQALSKTACDIKERREVISWIKARIGLIVSKRRV